MPLVTASGTGLLTAHVVWGQALFPAGPDAQPPAQPTYLKHLQRAGFDLMSRVGWGQVMRGQWAAGPGAAHAAFGQGGGHRASEQVLPPQFMFHFQFPGVLSLLGGGKSR